MFFGHDGRLKYDTVAHTFNVFVFIISTVLYLFLALVYPQHAFILVRLYTVCHHALIYALAIPYGVFIILFFTSVIVSAIFNRSKQRLEKINDYESQEEEELIPNHKKPRSKCSICCALVFLSISILALFITFLAIALGVLQLRTVPERDGTYSPKGVRDTISIRHEGPSNVIHIKANNDLDVFFAQGWVSARERSWLFEFQKRVAYGTLSEIVGDAAYSVDSFARTIGFHRAAVSALESLSPSTKQVLDAYCDGYNAWLETEPPLPIEFTIFKSSPTKCTPLDIVVWGKIMYWFNTNNLRNEVDRLLMLSVGTSLQRALELLPTYPDHAPTIIDTLGQLGLNITQEEIDLIEKQVHDNTHAYIPGKTVEPIVHDELLSSTLLRDSKTGASNSWAVDGRFSASGKPMIANDPHLGLQSPTLWLIFKLESPNFNAFGTAFVGVPGLVLGRNDHIAFTMTNGISDQQDLYVLTIDPKDSNRYIIDGESIPFEIITETIHIAGQPERKLQVKITKWGPVINDAHPTLKTFQERIALRWSGLLHNDTSLDTFSCHWRASSWEQYSNCFQTLFGPTMNNIYADVNGTIGYVTAGKIPKRKLGHSGLFAVQGNTKKVDYDGYWTWEDSIRVTNPKSGILASSNNRVTPPGIRYPSALDFESFFRVERTRELVKENMNIEYMKQIQLDRTSKYFFHLRSAIVKMVDTEIAKKNARTKFWIEKLSNWDGVMKQGTQEGTLFEFWIDQLARIPSKELGQERLKESAHMMYILKMMNSTNDTACNGSCIEVAANALDRVIQQLIKVYGDVPLWGESDVHEIEFRHQVLNGTPLRCLVTVKTRGIGGTETVNVADANFVDFENGKITTLNGPNFRMLVDMGDADSGLFMFDLGQDGNMLTKEYDENLQNWKDGNYFKIYMSSDKVPYWRYQQTLTKEN